MNEDWVPAGWWRVTYSGGLWWEGATGGEGREELAKCPGGGMLEQAWTAWTPGPVRVRWEWRKA